MLFNSYSFLINFFPLLFFIYFVLIKLKRELLAKAALIIGSLYFISFAKITNLYIFGASIILNFLFYKLNSRWHKKVFLISAIIFNVGLLGYFKYTNFIVENLNNHFSLGIGLEKVFLPLSISFYTFQQISFLVDSYKEPAIKYSFIDYCTYITFFPQLGAGPITRHDELIPQLREKLQLNWDFICKGLILFSLGLAKKVLIADYLASKVALGFDTLESLTLVQGWLTSLSYSLQLYFDFSGYCDMAIGLGLIFGLKLPYNFNTPYKSASIKEFWNRWHMTLGSFLSKYIYIPLGGNRKGPLRTYMNLLIVFLISGVWHGAGWLFIFWGLLHGIAMVVHRFWTKHGVKLPRILSWFITINFVNIAWIFFRAANLSSAIKVIKSMCKFNTLLEVQNLAVFGGKTFFFTLIVLIIAVLLWPSTEKLLERLSSRKIYAFILGMLLAYAALSLDKLSTFIYFNF